jgi:hypothetical protein
MEYEMKYQTEQMYEIAVVEQELRQLIEWTLGLEDQLNRLTTA